MPVSITPENFDQEISQETKPIVMDVFATWCGPCQQMTPIFDELEKEFGDTYKFTTLNVDEARDISIKYGVTSVPTFVFIKDGKVVGKATGFIHKEDLQEKIKASLG